jgi:uncharacterized membrane protein YraQ (UPF0718 family)
MRDSVDTGMYFTIGAALTAIFNTSALQQGLGDFMSGHIVIAVATMMALAFILSLCSTSDAFVAATLKVSFPSQAYEYAAKLGFLVFGPMVDVKLLFMYASIFRAKFVWMLVCGLFLLVGAICSLWSLIPVERLPFKTLLILCLRPDSFTTLGSSFSSLGLASSSTSMPLVASTFC